MNIQWRYLIAVLVGLLMLVACNESLIVTSAAVFQQYINQSPDRATVTVTQWDSRHSGSFGAGQIQMTYKLLDKPLLDVKGRLFLQFVLPPQQALLLSFNDNNDIELMHASEIAYAGTDNGVIEVIVSYKPRQEGKTYLKFIASTNDGKSIRAFAIALPVADASGIVPARRKTTKSRIELPSSKADDRY